MLACSVRAAESVPVTSPSIEPVRALDMAVSWPGDLDREAFVVLEYDVLANGTVANVRLVDDGFHEERFVEAAIAAVRKAKWQPRRVNGEAVDSPGMRQSFRFSLPDVQKGITYWFRAEAKKVEELLQKGDYAGGEFHAQWMLSEKVVLNYEYAVLEAQLGQTYVGLGRLQEASNKLGRATARSGSRPAFLEVLDSPPPNNPSNYLFEKDILLPFLELRMRVLAAQGLMLEALHVYYEMAGLETIPPDDARAVIAAQLTSQIRGSGSLRGKIEIGKSAFWRQYLSRRKFTLEKVRDGRIEELSLNCSGGSMPLEYVPGEVWTVPEGWGPCTAEISAETGTGFEFVEYPDPQ